jgi:hypothetical protein
MKMFRVKKEDWRPAMCCRKILKSIALILFLGVLMAASAAATTWINSEIDKDLLTGQNYSYLRIASGLSGSNRRYLDILKGPQGYQMRFVVPQPTNTHTTIWAPGAATSRSAKDLGETVSWMVEGKTAHTVSPTLNKRKRHMGVTDYEASWPVTCSDLTELLTGKTLRVVMPEFNGEWDLKQLPQSFEKIIGVASKKIVQGTAPECAAASDATPANVP